MGMFQTQAEKVMDEHINDPANNAMEGRWNDDIEGYPPQLLATVFVGIELTALEWIKKNCPNAWFRACFKTQEATR